MAEQPVDIGASANDPAADTIRDAFAKVNDNIAELYDLSGVNDGDLGTFTGSTISDAGTIKAALQELETALEAVVTESAATVTESAALVTLSGVASAAEDLGTFTGTTIPDTQTVKAALQALETRLETVVPAAGVLKEGVQSLSGAGAVNLTAGITAFTSTDDAQALTLADGVAGQRKTIVHVVDGGSGVLTPTNFGNGTTITFTDAGDAVELVFVASAWWVVALNGAVVA